MTEKEKIIRTKQLRIIRKDNLIAIIKGRSDGISQNDIKKLYDKRRRISLALRLIELGGTNNATY